MPWQIDSPTRATSGGERLHVCLFVCVPHVLIPITITITISGRVVGVHSTVCVCADCEKTTALLHKECLDIVLKTARILLVAVISRKYFCFLSLARNKVDYTIMIADIHRHIGRTVEKRVG